MVCQCRVGTRSFKYAAGFWVHESGVHRLPSAESLRCEPHINCVSDTDGEKSMMGMVIVQSVATRSMETNLIPELSGNGKTIR